MKKKGKKSDKRKRNIVTAIIIVILVIAVIFIVLNYQKKWQKKEAQEQEANISIPQNSFTFMAVFYLNEGYDRTYCDKDIQCQGINGITLQCPKVDQLTMRFRTFSFNSLAFISCTANDEENRYTKQYFAFYPVGKIAELSLQNIAYDREHNFDVCCKYDDGKVKSDEFCFPTIKVKSLCT